MREPTLAELDDIRREGLRPGVVACLVKDNKLLMAYRVEYGLWQIPQGGIRAGETLRGALLRTVEEELGEKMAGVIDVNIELIGSDKMEFPEGKVEGQTLLLESGDEVAMRGKFYYFAATTALESQVDMTQSIYGVVRWVDNAEAERLVSEIYQKGKRRVTEGTLKLLKEVGAIS